MRMTPQAIAQATGGHWTPRPPGGVVHRVSTDTRSIEPGDLFVALRGERFDAHRFLVDAVRRGACGVVIDRAQAAHGVAAPALAVPDTQRALGDIAAAWRGLCNARRVGVVGSSGKTTCKDILAGILSAQAPTLATEGNLNNLVGVPLTLLRLDAEHRYAAVEMGMNEAGELDRLTRILDPHVLLILAVGTAHIGCFGSMEGLIAAKGEALRALSDEAAVVYDAQSPNTCEILKRWLGARGAVRFAIGERADLYADNVCFDREAGAYRFDLRTGRGESAPVALHVFGAYNVRNAVAAAAAASEMGVSLESSAESIAAFRPRAMRSETRLIEGRTVVVDCYNANPDSMAASLDSLGDMASEESRVALVLGEMLELGEASERCHEELAERVAAMRPVATIGFGQAMEAVVERVRPIGGQALWTSDPAEAVDLLRQATAPGDVVFLKGSRGNRLERVVDAWQGAPDIS